ncbi:MAG TPA: tetratricopeptide repeat protein [Gaiellaceae bacterium]|jgi:tetratricopeptide (TPR) repeat protein
MSNFERAEELNKIGKWDQALPYAERAVSDDRQWAGNWCLLGWTLHELGRYRESLSAVDEALRLSPDSEWAHRTRSATLAKLGRRTDALAAAREAVRQAPNEWRAWSTLATTAYSLGYPADARKAAERSVKLAPGQAFPWVTLSYVCLDDEWEDAADAALRALRLEPENASALNNLGWARFRQGRYSEARDVFDRGIAIRPGHTTLVINRAMATIYLDGLETGDAEYARAQTLRLSLADKQLRDDPANVGAYITRSSVLRLRDGDHVAAFEAARRAVAADPRSATAWSALDDAAASLDRWRLARYAARRAVRAEPSAPGRWLGAAFTAHYAGLPDEARRWARRVVEEAPDSIRANRASALLALLDGDPAQARDLSFQDLQRYGESCCVRMFILRCSLELSDIAGAREALDRAEHWRPRCHCFVRTRYERILAGS